MVYLEEKRKEVLEVIDPLCKLFYIDYDYIIKPTGQRETLKLNDVYIGCSGNSTQAIVHEIIGYLFVSIFARNRSLGHFRTQVLNQVRRYWINKE